MSGFVNQTKRNLQIIISQSENVDKLISKVSKILGFDESENDTDKRPVWRTVTKEREIAKFELFYALYRGNYALDVPPYVKLDHTILRNLNLLKLLTNTFVDLTIGKGAEVNTPHNGFDNFLNKIYRLPNKFKEWLQLASIFGWVGAQITTDDEHGVGAVTIPPHYLDVKYVMGTVDEIEYISKKLFYNKLADVKKSTKASTGFVFEERHFKGYIEYYLYEVEGRYIIKHLPVTDFNKALISSQGEQLNVVQTGVDDFLIQLIYTDKIFGEFLSDYDDGVADIVKQLNWRWTSISRILNIHSDPKLLLPETFKAKDPVTGRAYIKGLTDEVLFFNVHDKAIMTPQYLTWDGNLGEQYKDLDKLTNAFATITGMSINLIVTDNSGRGVESALKYKLNLIPTLNKVNSKITVVTPVLAKIVKLLFDLSVSTNALIKMVDKTNDILNLEAVTDKANDKQKQDIKNTMYVQQIGIKFTPALPQDENRLADDAGTRVTIKRYLQTVYNMSEEEAEKELVDIGKEEAMMSGGAGVSDYENEGDSNDDYALDNREANEPADNSANVENIGNDHTTNNDKITDVN